MFERAKLYLKKNPYDTSCDDLFLGAMKKNVNYHLKHSLNYKKIANQLHFDLSQLKTMDDLSKIPMIPTAYLKEHDLFTMAAWRLPIKATSSGTSGHASKLGFNCLGLIYGGLLSLRLFMYHQLFSFKRTNYLILGYEPHKSNQRIITKTQNATTWFALPKHKEYVLKYKEQGYEVDFKNLIQTLDKYAQAKNPVRFVGLPSYTYFLLSELKKQNKCYHLPKNSMLLLGGGWKDHYKQKVEKENLYELVEEILGIPEENCHEFFGVAEHPSLYCSCVKHHFHVPKYSRIIIRDVKTLEPLPNGELGLVNLLTPLAESMPLCSIMTDDLGILHDGKQCGCGIDTPYLEIIGRIGMKQVQTCAVSANEVLKAVKIDG